MKRFIQTLVLFRMSWRWHVDFLVADEKRLHLLEALEAKLPPRFWEGKEAIPMELVGRTGLVDDYPKRASSDEATFVRIVDPDGSEWKELLEWRAAGGLYKPTMGPPNNNPRMHRIVSGRFKDAMQRFVLPPHRFYPMVVTHEVTKEQREYWMFHLLGDLLTEEQASFWDAQNFYILEKSSGKRIARFQPGTAGSFEEFTAIFRETYPKMGYAPRTTICDHSYFIYREPYDLVWGDGWMALSEEMAAALSAEFGEEYIGEWVGKPTLSGFDPERDQVPEELLAL